MILLRGCAKLIRPRHGTLGSGRSTLAALASATKSDGRGNATRHRHRRTLRLHQSISGLHRRVAVGTTRNARAEREACSASKIGWSYQSKTRARRRLPRGINASARRGTMTTAPDRGRRRGDPSAAFALRRSRCETQRGIRTEEMACRSVSAAEEEDRIACNVAVEERAFPTSRSRKRVRARTAHRATAKAPRQDEENGGTRCISGAIRALLELNARRRPAVNVRLRAERAPAASQEAGRSVPVCAAARMNISSVAN